MGQYPGAGALSRFRTGLLLLSLLPAVMAGEAAPIPLAEAVRTMERARPAPGEAAPVAARRAEAELARFLAELDRAGGAVPPAAGASAVERALAASAVAYHAESVRWEALVIAYGRPPPGAEVEAVLAPAALDPAHLAEPWRPFWRLVLVAPPTAEVEFMRPRACQAVAAEGDAAAVPLLAWRLGHPDETGADALVECLGRLDHDDAVAAVVAGLRLAGRRPDARPGLLAAGRRALASLLAGDHHGHRRDLLAGLAAGEADPALAALFAEALADGR